MLAVRTREWDSGHRRVPQVPRGALFAGCVLASFLLVAILGRSAAPYDPWQLSERVFQPPSRLHLLGTNDLGQDVFSEVIVGTRRSLLVGLSVAALSTVLAWGVGLASGVAPRGHLLIAASDLLPAIPTLPLLVLLAAYVGPGVPGVIAAMGALSWPAFARVVRTQVLSTREREYVVAALAAGAGTFRVMSRHISPGYRADRPDEIRPDRSLGHPDRSEPRIPRGGGPWSGQLGNMLNHAFRDPLLFTRPAWVWSAFPPAAAIIAVVLSLALVAQIFEARMRRALPES